MSRSLAQRPLKLGFLSPHNPFDRRAFSGTVHFAARALQATPDVSLGILGDYAPPRPVLDRLLRRRYTADVAHIDVGGLDAVIGLVATPLLADLAHRHPRLPFFHVTDATPEFLREAYGWHVPAEADDLERQAVSGAHATVYSSDIIANRAPTDLGLPGLSPAVIPFGVNLDALPDICPEKPPLDRLELLFVGLDWVRKGGDVVIAALDALKADDRRAHLTVIGACPERHRNRRDVTYLGYLDKNRRRDAARIAAAYRRAHLLLLPSRADCTPMVVSEAMAHGAPVLATDTGGLGAMIRASGGGRLISEFAAPRDWAQSIRDVTDDADDYAFMADAGIDHVQSRASWAHWAGNLCNLVRERLNGNVHYIRDGRAA
ncbi:MAG: glycosyltransferase family 4 protein [Silicimonas sp.]|nr:glycosyltransferase family 4 protein [Silicimonas sp.]